MDIEKNFFMRSPDIVARELLGKVLVRKIGDEEMRARIVETEAYFDENDPASRARQNGDLRETMLMNAGTILVYGVHNSWLINFVTGSEGKAEAVLIRAIEPLNFEEKCNGPGLLTKSFQINKSFHKQNLFDNEELFLEEGDEKGIEIIESFRIGVSEDLDKPMRFFIKENEFVSRK